MMINAKTTIANSYYFWFLDSYPNQTKSILHGSRIAVNFPGPNTQPEWLGQHEVMRLLGGFEMKSPSFLF